MSLWLWPKADSGGEIFGKNAASHLTLAVEGLGERCKQLQRGPGQSPGRKRSLGIEKPKMARTLRGAKICSRPGICYRGGAIDATV